MSNNDILKAALKLPSRDRVRLATRLLESIEPDLDDSGEVDKAWRREVERRLKETEAGRLKTTPWSEVRLQMMTVRAKPKR